jgi:signal transduction histidine kinase/DNA-binding CsgD family transcriptional regulator
MKAQAAPQGALGGRVGSGYRVRMAARVAVPADVSGSGGAVESRLELLTGAAAAIMVAEPGEIARRLRPVLAPVVPHEALAVLIGQCPETPLDLWAGSRLRPRLERAEWGKAVGLARAGGEVRLLDFPVSLYAAAVDGADVAVVLLGARRAAAASELLMPHIARLVAARFDQARRLASPPALAAAQVIASERRRVAETMQGRLQVALESVLATLRAGGDAAGRLRRAEEVASVALVELRASARAEVEVAETTAAAVLAGLQAELEPAAERVGVVPEFHLEGSGDASLPQAVALVAAYVTRGAVRNAYEHAAAGRVRVLWRLEPTGVVVTVADDGRGFELEAADGSTLRGMAGRASALGGELEVETSPGWGTRVRARLPTSIVEARGDAERARELVARLGERERQVLALVADGARNREVAAALHLSPHTVKAHVANIMTKLEAHSRVEVGRIFMLARVEADAAEACELPRTG